jgi:hypothetical protein
MAKPNGTRISLGLAVIGALVFGGLRAEEKKTEGESAKWVTAVKPKELSENVKKGLAWLAQQQMENGAWTQGEESSNMGAKKMESPSVADTCVTALAMIRSGSTPKDGDYAKNVLKAIEFVCSEIEKNKDNTLFITDLRGTRVQSKIGQYIDTFMACLLLSEAKGCLPDEKNEARLTAALDKVIKKMSDNQNKEGGWGDQAWAATVGESYGVRGLNRAKQAGSQVADEKLELSARKAGERFDGKSGGFKPGADAGVSLYSTSSTLGGLQDADNTNASREQKANDVLKNSTDANERREAEQTLKSVSETRAQLQKARGAVVAKMEDPKFVAGFGSNGGEEFLSYLSIGESLVIKGGADWEKWDKNMTDNLNRVQNNDGSWTGHHCITGRTFCTSTALMVLMVDRTPVPIAAEFKRR